MTVQDICTINIDHE